MNYAQQLKRFSRQRARAKKLRATGIRVPEIARRLKISRQRVYQITR